MADRKLSLAVLALAIGIIFYALFPGDVIKDSSTLNRILQEEYSAQGVSENWQSDFEFKQSELDSEGNVVYRNGNAIASSMAIGMVNGELSERFGSCPQEVTSRIFGESNKSENLDECRLALTETKACTESLESFLADPNRCARSLGFVAPILFSKIAPHCAEDSAAAGCTTYRRLSAQLKYLNRAINGDSA